MTTPTTPEEHLERAIELAHGPTALAAKITGITGRTTTRAHVWNWQNRDDRLPADYVLPICRAVDFAVIPHELRPDLYPNPTDGMPQQPAA